jgi:2-(1,2-epoxy-1,2-dihydrophenyl)acetyl-CoA isomerase
MTELVKVADAGHVRTITLNRPEKKNALSNELAWGVIEAVEAAAKDDNVWVVALTGSGDSFCAGLDLSPAASASSPLSPSRRSSTTSAGSALPAGDPQALRQAGGGRDQRRRGRRRALAWPWPPTCDRRRSARLMAGYTRIGGSPDAGLTITLPQAMGYERPCAS